MAAVVCGFCRRGEDAVKVCGKLWHDSDKNCTAHQRCMVRFCCTNNSVSGRLSLNWIGLDWIVTSQRRVGGGSH